MKTDFLTLALMVFVLQGCIRVTITRSEKRAFTQQSIQLPNNIILTSCGEVNINNVDFFPSSFRIEAQGKVIYIDPLAFDDAMPADYIFITHAHPDHLSLPDIRNIVKKETLIICSKKTAKMLSDYTIKVVEPGDILTLGNIKCEAVAAYNIRPKFLWIEAHPKSAMNVGFILTINGARIYHAGDTDFIPEMDGIKDITAALVPIGGDRLTMDPEQAAALINSIKPLIAVPMHYVIGKNYASKFRQLVDKQIKVEIVDNG